MSHSERHDPCNECKKTKCIHKNVKITGTLDVKCNTTLEKNLTVMKNETVYGDSTIVGNLSVGKNIAVGDDATIGKNLSVNCNAQIDGDLTVLGCIKDNGTTIIKQSDLPYTISKPGYYKLCGNLVFSPTIDSSAIQVLSNDVTIDLNGFSLKQTNSTANVNAITLGDVSGLVILNNITVKNGSISNFTGVGVKALNLTVAPSVQSFKDIQLLDLNILDCGTSIDQVENPNKASGIDLDSVFQEVNTTFFKYVAYENVTLKNCNVERSLGNAGINIQTGNNVTLINTQANKTQSNYGGNIFWDQFQYFIVSGIVIVANNVLLENCKAIGTKFYDGTNSFASISAGLYLQYSHNGIIKNCQFNDTYGEYCSIVCNALMAGFINGLVEDCQFNNSFVQHGGSYSNAIHVSDTVLQQTNMLGIKFVNCQFNGARIGDLAGPAGSQMSGPFIFTGRDIVFENCQACDIGTYSPNYQVYGFNFLTAGGDPIPYYGNVQNITFSNCIASNIFSTNSHTAGFRVGSASLAGNRTGVQGACVNTVVKNCVAENIRSFTSFGVCAGITQVVLASGSASSGPAPKNSNIYIENCRISDVRAPSPLSGGIVVQSTKRPVILNNSISDCDRGILFTGTDSITPATLFQLATSSANALASPPIFVNLLGTTNDSTGTASQTDITVQGVGTAFTSAMVGGTISFSPVSGTGTQSNNIVTADNPIFTSDMIGSMITFTNNAYSTYIVEYYTNKQVAVSTVLPVALPASQPFTVNYNITPIVAVDVTNQKLTVAKQQNLPQQPFVINYGYSGSLQTFANQSAKGGSVTLTTSNSTVQIYKDWLVSSSNLNTSGTNPPSSPWATGDPILYTGSGLPNLISGNTYYLIVYVPGYCEKGIIQDNKIDNCTISGYEDRQPITSSAWINNIASFNGTNYNINWSGTPPIDTGLAVGPFPVTEHKSYNLSLN